MTHLHSLSNHVHTHRKRMHMTQEDLAGRVGVSRQTIIAIEKGNYTPTLALAFSLAKTFSVTIEELFYYAK